MVRSFTSPISTVTELAGMSNEELDEVLAHLEDVLNSKTVTDRLPQHLVDNSRFMELRSMLLDMRCFVLAIAAGNLSPSMQHKGAIAGALKGLQASLRHLTWQTTMIAGGDFSQRVDFMGEFSESFNSMVCQLDKMMKQVRLHEQELVRLTHTDPLTGINNRGYFMELLSAELERSRRYGRIFSILMFDLDHFKKVNDNYGHAAGDEALKRFVEVLRNAGLRQSDFWGRLGGEEFALVLPETGISQAGTPAERIRALLEGTPVTHGDATFNITVSIGVTEYVSGENAESLLNRADMAMYRAKQTGRNRICLS